MVKWISCFVVVLFTLANHAHTYAQPPAADQQETNDHNGSAGQKERADTPGAQEAAANTNADTVASVPGTAAGNPAVSHSVSDTASTFNAAASNTPPVEQTTTSGSGSPAVLSGKNGDNRDGTNNVQRATMNMAGAPAANLSLSEDDTVDPDSEMAQRRDRTQDKAASARQQGQTTRASDSNNESGRLHENTEKGNKEIKASDKESKEEKTGIKKGRKGNRG